MQVWPFHKVNKVTLLLFVLSVRDFRRLVHYSVLVARGHMKFKVHMGLLHLLIQSLGYTC